MRITLYLHYHCNMSNVKCSSSLSLGEISNEHKYDENNSLFTYNCNMSNVNCTSFLIPMGHLCLSIRCQGASQKEANLHMSNCYTLVLLCKIKTIGPFPF